MPQKPEVRRREYRRRIKEKICPKCLDNNIEPDTSSCKECKKDMREYREEHLDDKEKKDKKEKKVEKITKEVRRKYFK